MRAGLLRHLITIQTRAAGALDSYGGSNPAWSTFAEVWAQIEPTTGREYVKDGANKAALLTRFVLRYLDGVTPQMRVSFEGKVYNIREVINERQRNRMLTLVCEAGSTNG